MSPLPSEDLHHLQAAQGWLELGNHLEAIAELDKIPASQRTHPAVLALRWSGCAMAKQWEACAEIAKAMTQLLPDHDQSWVNLANSLYFAGHTQAAYDCLKP